MEKSINKYCIECGLPNYEQGDLCLDCQECGRSLSFSSEGISCQHCAVKNLKHSKYCFSCGECFLDDDDDEKALDDIISAEVYTSAEIYTNHSNQNTPCNYYEDESVIFFS